MCETVHEGHVANVQDKACEKETETWLADSGTTCHLTNNAMYLKKHKTVQTSVRVSSGDVVYDTVKGDVELVLSSGKKLRLHDSYVVRERQEYVRANGETDEN